MGSLVKVDSNKNPKKTNLAVESIIHETKEGIILELNKSNVIKRFSKILNLIKII